MTENKEKIMSQTQKDEAAIEKLIKSYINVLSQSKTEAVLALFTRDALLMAADAPTMRGEEQLKAFFDQSFGAIKLEAELEIDEIAINGNSAVVISHSRVRMTLLQTNETHREETRELFILNRDPDDWKIARYMFNKVISPR